MKTLDEFTTKTGLEVLVRVSEEETRGYMLLMIDGEVFPLVEEDATRISNALKNALKKEG